MVEDIFGGLLEVLVEGVIEFVVEVAGELIDVSWPSGGGEDERHREATFGAVGKYERRPNDSDV